MCRAVDALKRGLDGKGDVNGGGGGGGEGGEGRGGGREGGGGRAGEGLGAEMLLLTREWLGRSRTWPSISA